MKYLSREHKILRYLAKMALNKNNPLWQANPHVQRVLTNGEVDLEKVKSLFEERGMMTRAEFDTNIQALKSSGFVDNGLKANQRCIDRFNAVETARQNAIDQKGKAFDRLTKSEIEELNNLEL